MDGLSYFSFHVSRAEEAEGGSGDGGSYRSLRCRRIYLVLLDLWCRRCGDERVQFSKCGRSFLSTHYPSNYLFCSWGNDVGGGQVLTIDFKRIECLDPNGAKPSGGTLPFNSHRQRVRSCFRVECVSHRPGNDLPGIDVEDRGKVEPAFFDRNLPKIGEPDLFGCLRCKVARKQVGSIGQLCRRW